MCSKVFCLVRHVVLQAMVTVVPGMVTMRVVPVMKGGGSRVHCGKSGMGGCNTTSEGRC